LMCERAFGTFTIHKIPPSIQQFSYFIAADC
jgi:hypothetical protein